MNLRLISLIITGLNCAATYAGTMGPVCIESAATIPCARNTWEAGITALYLSSDAINADTTVNNVGNGTTFNSTKGAHGKYDWGFMLEASYHFNTGNDMNLNWTHFHEKIRNQFINKRTSSSLLENTYNNNIDKTEFDIVNIELAQSSHFGSQTNMRLHGGVQYARIAEKDLKHASSVATNPQESSYLQTTSTTHHENSKFEGFGPRLGVDGKYKLTHGFSLKAQAAIGILVGQSSGEGLGKLSGSAKSTTKTGDLVVTETSSGFSSESNYAYVPEIDFKLSASKNWYIRESEFNLTAGWFFYHATFLVQGPFVQAKIVI